MTSEISNFNHFSLACATVFASVTQNECCLKSVLAPGKDFTAKTKVRCEGEEAPQKSSFESREHFMERIGAIQKRVICNKLIFWSFKQRERGAVQIKKRLLSQRPDEGGWFLVEAREYWKVKKRSEEGPLVFSSLKQNLLLKRVEDTAAYSGVLANHGVACNILAAEYEQAKLPKALFEEWVSKTFDLEAYDLNGESQSSDVLGSSNYMLGSSNYKRDPGIADLMPVTKLTGKTLERYEFTTSKKGRADIRRWELLSLVAPAGSDEGLHEIYRLKTKETLFFNESKIHKEETRKTFTELQSFVDKE